MRTTLFNFRAGGRRAPALLFALAAVALTSACAQTQSAGPEVTLDRSGAVSVLLMPADVELSLLTTGGALEPNAEWTEQGRQNVIAALKEEMAERSIETVSYADDSDPSYQIASQDEQLVKLHEAVGNAIILDRYIPGNALPTKKNRFDWTLGEGVHQLRDAHRARYALFVFARDSFSSDGRVALSIAMALLGVSVQGGQQLAFASLVDLETGNVLWFNLLRSTVGDLRDPKQAGQAVDQLLKSSPL